MNKLPEDILMIIASMLPYNERVEVNKFLPLHMRVVKKLDSEAHHIRVVSEMFARSLDTINSKRTPRQKTLLIIKMMRNQTSNKNCLILKHKKFRNAVINKCNEFLDEDYDMSFIHYKIVNRLKNTCKRLLKKIETIEPSDRITNMVSCIVKII